MCASDTWRKKIGLRGGFTLVEMIVALAIFSFVMTATVAALLAMIDEGHKAEGSRSIIDNLNLVVESMSRNIRTGTNYGSACVGGAFCAFSMNNEITFTAYDGRTISYRLNTATRRVEISDSTVNGGVFFPMTDPQVSVQYLGFLVRGIAPANSAQPTVEILLSGTIASGVGSQVRTQTGFNIETFVSERVLNASTGGGGGG